MLTLLLFVLAVICWLIALILRKDPAVATPVVFLGIIYFVLGAIFLTVATW